MAVKRLGTAVLVLLCAFIASAAAAKAPQLNDDQVKQQIIEASIASYLAFALVRLIGRETAVPVAGAAPRVKQEVMRQFVIRKKSLKR